MSSHPCPDLEQLFIGLLEGDEAMAAHAAGCEACATLVEAHRQLEKDLVRISDPLPPPNFVHLVMAKVEQAPVPLRQEVWTGAGIFAAALIGVLAVVFNDTQTAGALGAWIASSVLSLRDLFSAAGAGVRAVWVTAGLPVVALASLSFLFVLFGLRRLAPPLPHRVSA